MKYRHFLFDLDDTLLDFRSSERQSFDRTMAMIGLADSATSLYPTYRRESAALWAELEKGKIGKDFLRVERFRRAFKSHGIEADPLKASSSYLDIFPETVVLIEGAKKLCETLASAGEIGIITNGVDVVQRRRIENSGLSQYFSFVATSDKCGIAKPDARFFEYAAGHFHFFSKPQAIIVGDRIDGDIAGAAQFGIDSCWFNPMGLRAGELHSPTFEVSHLNEIDGYLRV